MMRGQRQAERMTRATACLALLLCGLLGGCRAETEQRSGANNAAPGATARRSRSTRQESGASQRAWLGTKGNAGDSGFCDALLKLPLARKPAWEWTYSRAELADANLSSLLHYDGTLFVSAYCPQIAGVSVKSGTTLFNAVQFAERGERVSSREFFTSLFLHPDGLLLGADNLSRRYCWESSASGLRRLWLREGNSEQSYMGVPVPSAAVASFQEGLHALNLEDGSTIWKQPLLQRNRRFRDNSNIVASDAGQLLWCSGFGDMESYSGESGAALWAAAGPATLRGLALDPAGTRAYIGYQNEHLECRALADGSLLWDFDYGTLTPPDERARFQAEVEDGETYRARLAGLGVSADGVLLVLFNGHCAWLGLDGKLRWQLRADSMLMDGLVLRNAILLTQFAAIPRSAQRRAAQGDEPLLLPPWPVLRGEIAAAGIEAPPFDPQQLNITGFAGQLGGVALAVRFLALDPATGAELDSCESGVDFSVGPVPAYNMVLAGGGRSLSEALKPSSKEPRVLQAFDWLEWEGT